MATICCRCVYLHVSKSITCGRSHIVHIGPTHSAVYQVLLILLHLVSQELSLANQPDHYHFQTLNIMSTR
jgi:hypothetical protein